MEQDRHMVAYQCRMMLKMKRLLLQKAAEERRTANKIVEDALYIYFGLEKESRKTLKKEGVRAVKHE